MPRGKSPSVIERCAIEQPAVYLRVIASILPKDVNINTTRSLDDLTDDQLMRKPDGHRDGTSAVGQVAAVD